MLHLCHILNISSSFKVRPSSVELQAPGKNDSMTDWLVRMEDEEGAATNRIRIGCVAKNARPEPNFQVCQ